MKIVAFVMVGIVLLVGAFLGYCYFGAQMQIEAAASAMTPAVDAIGTYDSVVGQLADGAFYGTVFQETEMLMPESFAFLTVTVRMKNPGMLPMEWITIEIKPDPADVLQLVPERTPSLAANSRADFSATVLTRTGASTAREIVVHYYVLGQQRTATYQWPSQ